jgi:hypothetical protein
MLKDTLSVVKHPFDQVADVTIEDATALLLEEVAALPRKSYRTNWT